MNAEPRRARVSALAKINLGLRVLHKRPDGFHELRTIFQTVSLADALDIEFAPFRRTRVSVKSSPEIADNLVERAAWLVLEEFGLGGSVEMRLTKRIPMGAGLGGGSSDAAAVLLALPALAGRRPPLDTLIRLAGCLGSDVPFFLLGGTAVGLGRGTELYPMPDWPAGFAVLVAPEVHVSTAEAYRALGRDDLLTSDSWETSISRFQSWAWKHAETLPAEPAAGSCSNDFEPVVFREHPQLKSIKRQLERAGSGLAMLSGSGSALFGLFATRAEAESARQAFRNQRAFTVSLVGRARYRALWRRRLDLHIAGQLWPPQSRYAC